MKRYSCNNFVDSGEKLNTHNAICQNCGWGESTHHNWRRMLRPNGELGFGWVCYICHRSAYDMHGRCTKDTPPTDYPPCSTYTSSG